MVKATSILNEIFKIYINTIKTDILPIGSVKELDKKYEGFSDAVLSLQYL